MLDVADKKGRGAWPRGRASARPSKSARLLAETAKIPAAVT